MYQQVLDPVGDSLFLSALVAMIPLATLFVLLGGLKLKAHIAGLAALAGRDRWSRSSSTACRSDTSLAVATEGAAFGLFPIIWIIWNAIWIYNMTVETGHFAVLRRSFATISDDQRIQAIIIAFCFGALLEALAGFGTPVAITAVMLIAVGFKPMKAAAIALVANTAPVAFGAIATPIVTLAELTEIPKEDLGAMVGRQTPLLALFVPLILVGMVDGRRGVKAVWPAAIVGGFTFAVGQFVVLELHLGRADRHHRARCSRSARWSPSCASGSRATRCWWKAERRRAGPRSPAPRTHDAAHEAAVRRREGTGTDSRARHLQGLRAVPDHHRRLLARPVGADQGLPGQGHGRVHLARHRRHPRTPTARRRARRRSSSAGPARPARCCWSAA